MFGSLLSAHLRPKNERPNLDTDTIRQVRTRVPSVLSESREWLCPVASDSSTTMSIYLIDFIDLETPKT